jgi:serine/threonine protein kinase
MGIVYEAEHQSLKSRVALKVMHNRFRGDRSYLRRFRTEARSAARLHHTNIVTVFDFGEQAVFAITRCNISPASASTTCSMTSVGSAPRERETRLRLVIPALHGQSRPHRRRSRPPPEGS